VRRERETLAPRVRAPPNPPTLILFQPNMANKLSKEKRAQVMVLAKAVKKGKKILLPPRGQLPSPEVESQIDLWFLQVAKNLKLPIEPPKELTPWILVRLTCASARAKSCAEQTPIPPLPERTAEAIKLLTVDNWHAEMKNVWMVKDLSFGNS